MPAKQHTHRAGIESSFALAALTTPNRRPRLDRKSLKAEDTHKQREAPYHPFAPSGAVI